MPGTRDGGYAAAESNKERYGEDFYKRIGAKGGANGSAGKGFASMPYEKIAAAGAKGGAALRRRRIKE